LKRLVLFARVGSRKLTWRAEIPVLDEGEGPYLDPFAMAREVSGALLSKAVEFDERGRIRVGRGETARLVGYWSLVCTAINSHVTEEPR